jgi:hypothetical protein
MTQDDLSGMIWTLLPVQVSQIMSFPSNEPVTACLCEHLHFILYA